MAEPVSTASPRDEALRVVEAWARAFGASDVDAIVALYAPDALFIGTSSRSVVRDPQGIRGYFEAALLNNRPRGATLREAVIHDLPDGSVVVTGLDTVTGVRGGTPTSADGRVTFVLARRGDAWSIVHFHRSAMPA